MHTPSLAPSLSAAAPRSCAVAPAPPLGQVETLELGAQLFPYLRLVPDPRARSGRRYSLPALLVLCLVGLCAGCQGYRSVARWGRALPTELRRGCGFTGTRTPCASTFLNLFRVLAWEELAQQLRQWVEAALLASAAGADPPTPEPAAGDPVAPTELEGFAIDGKTLRGSLAAGADLAHLVSIVRHVLGVSVAEAAVPAKHGELTVAPELVAAVVGPNRVITGDALFAQRNLSEQIVAGESDYLFVVKDNQPTLRAEVEAVFAPELASEQVRRMVWTVNPGHGRIENRFLLLVPVTPAEVAWPGVQQVFFLERQRHRRGKDGAPQSSRECVYGITSLRPEKAGPAEVLALQRGHWSVENQVHWVLDTFFREDEKRIREGRIAQGMAALRRGALNLLRQLGGRAVAATSDRVKANPRLLLQLLGVPAEN